MRHPWVILPLIFVLGCGAGIPTPNPEPTDTDACPAAEQRLHEMNCRDRQGNPMWVNLDGVPFTKTCQDDQQEGRVALTPSCVVKSKTCEEAKQCPIN